MNKHFSEAQPTYDVIGCQATLLIPIDPTASEIVFTL